MTTTATRAALQKLHAERATLIRYAPVEWPETQLDRTKLPTLLTRRGASKWWREGSLYIQSREWHPTVYIEEANQTTLDISENRAIVISQQLGEIYLDPDYQILDLGGDPCRFASISQSERGDNAIGDTPVGIVEYRGREYYGFEFTIRTIEKWQPE